MGRMLRVKVPTRLRQKVRRKNMINENEGMIYYDEKCPRG